MNTVALDQTTFEEAVKKPGILLIDWWTEWCGPCRAFAPIYEQVAAAHPEATFAKIDVDAQPELAGVFGIQSIPTLMLLRDGIMLFNRPGMLSQSALEALLEKAAELDMDEVRREVDAKS